MEIVMAFLVVFAVGVLIGEFFPLVQIKNGKRKISLFSIAILSVWTIAIFMFFLDRKI